MRVVNDIYYADNLEEEITVKEVIPLDDGMMIVTFSTGEKRLFDAKTLEGSAFAPLANREIFANPVLRYGVITWDNGEIDIAPEYVYYNSSPYESPDASA